MGVKSARARGLCQQLLGLVGRLGRLCVGAGEAEGQGTVWAVR
jgi:hypothetical protein